MRVTSVAISEILSDVLVLVGRPGNQLARRRVAPAVVFAAVSPAVAIAPKARRVQIVDRGFAWPIGTMKREHVRVFEFLDPVADGAALGLEVLCELLVRRPPGRAAGVLPPQMPGEESRISTDD